MTVRFLTSIAGDSFSYLEGQTLDLPTPLPGRFLNWLRSGIVEPVKETPISTALAPDAVERAVARRTTAARRPGRRVSGRADSEGD